ncbi:NuA4 histone H4 acetyltransferase complex and the SWR1 complex subunit [Umbelopsis sp. WA50703]
MSNKRMKGTVATRALYYGNVASPLGGKKASDSDHTHKWTILVRGVNNEDISFWIKKVTFRLHETYPNPQRTIEQPPFEVSETGWGEFEIAIKIYFHAASGEKPITLYHHLRLHPYEDDGTGQPWPKDKPVTSFNYDEIVFNEPTEAFYQILQENNATSVQLPTKKSTKDPPVPFSTMVEQEELDRLDKSLREVNRQIQKERQRAEAITEEAAMYK